MTIYSVFFYNVLAILLIIGHVYSQLYLPAETLLRKAVFFHMKCLYVCLHVIQGYIHLIYSV